MKKKNVKKILPRPEYQSPYASKEPQQPEPPETNTPRQTKPLYKEEPLEEDTQDTSPYVPMSDSLSPYETMEEKIARAKKLRGTPTHNPIIEKELAKKKQPLPEEKYESPFESEEYKSKKLYKEEEMPPQTPSQKEDPSPIASLTDSIYESPYDSIEEKLEKVYYQKSTPSYNPVVEKQLKRKKRNLNRDKSQEEYESPFESEEYKSKKLYKEDTDNPEEEAPSLYQSPYEKVEAQRAHPEIDEDYNSFDLPYIETRVTSHIRGSRVMDYAFENANMDEDQQEVHYRQMKYAKLFLLCSMLPLVISLIVSLPPRLRHYHGDLGTYDIYHFQSLIVTPEGEEITYTRKTYQKALYYSFFMPDGEEVRTTSLHGGVQLHVAHQSLLTEQEQDLFNAMIAVEEDYRVAGDSYEDTTVTFLIQVSHVTVGVVLAMCPYYLVDFSVFCYPASSPEFRTAEFLKKCRNFAIGYALFAMTPWGARLHTNLIMNTMGRIINQWAGIMYVSMGN